MLKMIKLDWLGMKVYHKRFVIIPLGICLLGFISELFIIPMTAFYMLSFSVNPFAVEEKGKLDHLYMTMPITRKNVVNARFGLSLIMLAAGLVFSIAATVIFAKALYGKNFLYIHAFTADYKTILLLVCGALFLYALINLSTFPILFKLGYARGRALGFYIPVGFFVSLVYVVYLFVEYNSAFGKWFNASLTWAAENVMFAALYALLAAAAALAASYALSQKLFSRREF